jgi:hypothetical protein
MKKIYISLVVFLMVLLMPSAALALTPLPPHAPGTNIISNGTVYMITLDGQKRPYTSPGAFLSYGFNSWGSVQGANSADLSLPTGAFIPPQSGRIVCSDRGSDRGTCYLISYGYRHAFVSEAVFYGQGFNFGRALYGDVSFLPQLDNITSASATHLPGVLVNDNGTISIMEYSGRLGFPTLDIFNSWGLSFSDVVTANVNDRFTPFIGMVSTRVAGELDIPASGSLINPADSLQVLTPNGGEFLAIGSSQIISWNGLGSDPFVNIYLDQYRYCDSYQPCPAVLNKSYTIAASVSNTGSYTWIVGSVGGATITSDLYIIRITGNGKTDVSDSSDYPFSISTAYELQQAQASSRDAKRLADIRQLMTGLELYFNDHNGYPASLNQLTPYYIGQLPTAPTPADGSCGSNQNNYLYSTTDSNNYSLTFCLGATTGGYSAGVHTASASGIQ